MKKKLIIVITSLTIILIVVLAILFLNNKKDSNSSLEFKKEYEMYNGKNSKSGSLYKDVKMNSNNRFVYADLDKLKEVINGTGVIYFGFPECPWCRNAVSVIDDAANQVGLDEIYYLNVYDIRDEKELDESGNVITTKEGTTEYKELLSLLHDYLPEYKGLNNSDIKRIYVPLVMTFKNGNIIDTHLSTVDSQTDPYVDLNEVQYNELLDIYVSAFSQISGTCSSEC